MPHFTYIWYIFFGPRLYGRFSQSHLYVGNLFESTGNSILTFLNGSRHLCTVLSPFLLLTGHRHGWFQPTVLFNFGQNVLFLYLGGLLLRAFGRMISSEFRRFSALLTECKVNPGVAAYRKKLKDYDYDMWAAPFDYSWTSPVNNPTFVAAASDFHPVRFRPFCQVQNLLVYLSVHSFGRRMLYPGSVSLVNTLAASTLIENRRKLIRNFSGRRLTLSSQSGDSIDAVFVDRRSGVGENGHILVVTCEGNCGFYETGTMTTPMKLGYSVLGWNHPGFSQSTGHPYPLRNLAAVAVVVQYAIGQLCFCPSSILFFGWSIGGFTATWSAMNLPSSSLILDATFDDLLPLAQSSMPKSLSTLVHQAVRQYLDLPIAAQLARFDGPVTIIRRTKDEVLVTDRSSQLDLLMSNRSNPLIKSLLKCRFPTIFDEHSDRIVDDWLFSSKSRRMLMEREIDDDFCTKKLFQAVQNRANGDGNVFSRKNSASLQKDSFPQQFAENDRIFPISNGLVNLVPDERKMLILFLVRHYLLDFDSSHNTPLSMNLFRIPSHPWSTID